jgi:hypothetical protein
LDQLFSLLFGSLGELLNLQYKETKQVRIEIARLLQKSKYAFQQTCNPSLPGDRPATGRKKISYPEATGHRL